MMMLGMIWSSLPVIMAVMIAMVVNGDELGALCL